MNSLTVVVPFFNEENTIIESISKLNNFDFISQILLIDDGSTDDSYKLVEAFCSDKIKYQLIKLNSNQGKDTHLISQENILQVNM